MALVIGGLVEEHRADIEQLEALRMIEAVVEPTERAAVFVAMLRQREVGRVSGLEHDLGVVPNSEGAVQTGLQA